MSHATVYAFAESGDDYSDSCVLANAWHFVARVWDALAEKYMPVGFCWLCNNDPAALKQFWALADDDRLSYVERAVHYSTFDRAAVRRANFSQMANCFELFDRIHPPKHGSHLAAMSDLLRRWDGRDDIAYVGWHGTSVSENLWEVEVPLACEEGEGQDFDYRVYDFSKDRGHFFIFDKIAPMNHTAPECPDCTTCTACGESGTYCRCGDDQIIADLEITEDCDCHSCVSSGRPLHPGHHPIHVQEI